MRSGKASFFPHSRAALAASAALLFLIGGPVARAQQSGDGASAQTSSSSNAQPAPAAQEETPAPKKHHWIQKDEPAKGSKTGAASAEKKPVAAHKPVEKKNKLHIEKAERVVPTKDTKAEMRREAKYNPLVGKDADLPDKQLYDKALTEENKGHYDVARLDLQTLLNTYPESQYLMRAKLAVANSWFQEGGSASLAQAEQEYSDFITFFPNVPEAAEAQMRMGDIYMKQMDVPDRDYANALKAEEQYRIMLKTYPDAPAAVRKQAEQKLRDVQEVMAQREFELGQFYALRKNYNAAIARYQTVADTYPLFSHMDEVLIGLGDAYEADANAVRADPTCVKGGVGPCLPEGAKSKLEQQFDGKAASYYRDVVLNHAAALHVEDAKERLQGMNLPLPVPTAEQVAASDALEGSRAQYTMQKRLELLFVRTPDTVSAAQLGAPPLDDASPTVAPTVMHEIQADFTGAINPSAALASAKTPVSANPENGSASPIQPSSTPAAAPLTLSDPATASNAAVSDTGGTVTEVEPASPAETNGGGATVGGPGASLGAEVLTPGANVGTPATAPATPGTVAPGTMTGPAVTGLASDSHAATGTPDPNYGLVAPKSTAPAPLPAAEAPARAPDAVNEAAGQSQPVAQQQPANGKKKPKPVYDKNDESSSKHHKKKGLDKINPF